MDNTAFIIIIIQLIIIIFLSILNFKDNILNFMLGIRRKRAIFLDVRQSRTVTLSKDLKQFEEYGRVFVWNFSKELNGCNFFRTDNSEALDADLDAQKCTYWCDSNEYHTNLKNKLLETLMMLKSKDTIIMFLLICIAISGITLALLYFKTSSMIETLDSIKNTIQLLNSTKDISYVVR